jgi:hypothetical protein
VLRIVGLPSYRATPAYKRRSAMNTGVGHGWISYRGAYTLGSGPMKQRAVAWCYSKQSKLVIPARMTERAAAAKELQPTNVLHVGDKITKLNHLLMRTRP